MNKNIPNESTEITQGVIELYDLLKGAINAKETTSKTAVATELMKEPNIINALESAVDILNASLDSDRERIESFKELLELDKAIVKGSQEDLDHILQTTPFDKNMVTRSTEVLSLDIKNRIKTEKAIDSTASKMANDSKILEFFQDIMPAQQQTVDIKPENLVDTALSSLKTPLNTERVLAQESKETLSAKINTSATLKSAKQQKKGM
ncbi:hypothetical protein FGM00_11395 [Aggregatimonas sangjinii]|uniref:Uncharacterized protein n=1 Tax=Aggregatimonas sangjinii TaxID=2583587 RepID=A0A5B7SR20_9FLAO|nr:hypothetical protein [Aggregatimonas sangjinii]QCX00682.1 hypothetical protein FGM00_11395 [Aggregatimonas sangjinii]